MTKPGGPPSIPPRKLAAELVADIMQGKAKQAQEARLAKAAPPPRRRGRLLIPLIPLLVGLTIWNVLRMQATPTVFTPAQQEASLRIKIFLAAGAVEHFHDSTGVFPPSLAAVRMADPTLLYMPGATTYSLVGTYGATSLSYRHGDPLAPFAAGFTTVRARPQP